MKKMLRLVLIISILTGVVPSAEGEDVSDAREDKPLHPIDIIEAVQRDLVEEGFENVIVGLADDHLLIEYENRRYSSEMTAMGAVMAISLAGSPKVRLLTVLPKKRDIPLLSVTVRRDDYEAFVTGRMSPEVFASNAKISPQVFVRPDAEHCPYVTDKANGTLGKFDLVLSAGVEFRREHYNYPKIQLNAIPEVSTILAKGMHATVQCIIPLNHALDNYSVNNEVRPGRMVLNQILRLPHDLFTSLSVGVFDHRQYGFSVEAAHYLANGSLSLGGMVGYTGAVFHWGARWYYSGLKSWTYLLNGKYRLSYLDLSIGVGWGRYLHGDTGWRAEFSRSFGETDLGFFGIKTDVDVLGGFALSIPIPPAKRLVPNAIRPNLPTAVSWNYRYFISLAGRSLSTGYTLDGLVKHLNPVHVRRNIAELRPRSKALSECFGKMSSTNLKGHTYPLTSISGIDENGM